MGKPTQQLAHAAARQSLAQTELLQQTLPAKVRQAEAQVRSVTGMAFATHREPLTNGDA